MTVKLDAQAIIDFISQAKKVTPVKVYVKGEGVADLSYGEQSKVFGEGNNAVAFVGTPRTSYAETGAAL